MAKSIQHDLQNRVADLQKRANKIALDAVLVNPDVNEDNPTPRKNPARLYAENQRTTCERLGITYRLHELPAGAGYEEIAGRILLLNNDETVSAIMLHLPLPHGVDTIKIQSLIDPAKDVEGVNPANIGNIVYGRSSLVPCTALAVLKMVESTGVSLQGATVVCVGASNIVGKPIAVLMMQKDATVISCNKFTTNIEALTKQADILISAVGKPDLIRKHHVKPGAVVIDVGVNRITDPITKKRKTVGDVSFDEVSEVAGFLSPVPGGVGPMTVTMLLQNVVEATT